MTDLSNYRRSYEKSELLEKNLPEDPINLFKKWFIEAEEFGAHGEVNAMTVSTLGLDGFPNSRVVLLKQYTHEGFIFFTNYNSDKGGNSCQPKHLPVVLLAGYGTPGDY